MGRGRVRPVVRRGHPHREPVSQTLTLLVHSRYIDEFNEFGAYTAATLLMLSPSSFWC